MKLLFEEKQRFTQWWLWILISCASIAGMATVAFGLWTQLVDGKPWGDKPMDDQNLVIFSVVMVTAMGALLLVFFNAMLEVQVDKNSVSYRFFPQIRQWRRLEREAIQRVEPVDFFLRGYGVKRDLRGNRIVAVKGTKAVKVILLDGKELVIGTQRPAELLAALKMMKNPSEH